MSYPVCRYFTLHGELELLGNHPFLAYFLARAKQHWQNAERRLNLHEILGGARDIGDRWVGLRVDI